MNNPMQIKITDPQKIINFYNEYLSFIDNNEYLDSCSAHMSKKFGEINWTRDVLSITLNNYSDNIDIFIEDKTNISNLFLGEQIDYLKLYAANQNYYPPNHYKSYSYKLFNVLKSNFNTIG